MMEVYECRLLFGRLRFTAALERHWCQIEKSMICVQVCRSSRRQHCDFIKTRSVKTSSVT